MKLHTRWILSTSIPIVAGFALVLTMSRAILLYTADYSAEAWLGGAPKRTMPALHRRLLDDLGLRARHLEETGAVGRSSPVDPDPVAQELGSEPNLVWSLIDRDGSVRAGSSCTPLDPERPDTPFVECDGEPVLALSVPAGPGVLLLGRRIDADYVDTISLASQTEATLLGPDGVIATTYRDVEGTPFAPEEVRGDGRDLRSAAPSFSMGTVRGAVYRGYPETGGFEHGQSRFAAYLETVPLDAHHWLVLSVPQSVMRLGASYSSSYIAGITLVVMGAVVASVALFVNRLTNPLRELSTAAGRLERGDLHVSIPVRGTDEIAEVCRAFNQMVEAVRDGRRELAELSRIGGMAEIATGVLHNVGNVVNSVNVSAQIVESRLARLPTERLVQVAAMLDEHAHVPGWLADEKGRLARAYAAKATRALEEERQELLTHVRGLVQNVDRIKAVVQMQQAYAKTVSNRAPDRIDLVVDHALQIVRSSLDARGVTVHVDCDPIAPVSMDTQRIVQILANLVRNAADAVVAREGSRRRVDVRVRRGPDSIRVDVEDDGVGIPTEEMPRIFTFGHTTKPDGHGFGLHMSAIAAQGMGGSLTCRSDGRDRGARFTLEIPTRSDVDEPQEACA